jgi:hypothetical protein
MGVSEIKQPGIGIKIVHALNGVKLMLPGTSSIATGAHVYALAGGFAKCKNFLAAIVL